jgi:hypothetical protein
MPAIKVFDRKTVFQINGEILELLKQYGEDHGIVFEGNGGTYSSTNYTFKLKASVKNESGEVQTVEAANFKAYASCYGLRPEDLGRTFKCDFNGRKYKIIGCKKLRKNTKRPILVKEVLSGKKYLFGEETIQMYLRIEDKKNDES